MAQDRIEGLKPETAKTDELSLIDIANSVLRHRRLIVLLPLVLAGAVATYALLADREFNASTAFISHATSSRAASPTAGLARQFGLDIGATSSAQSPEFLVGLLRGNAILRQAVETNYTMASEGGTTRTASLIEIYDIEDEGGRPKWLLAVEELRSRITTAVEDESGVIRMTVTAEDPRLAEQIASRLVRLLNEFNLSLQRTRAKDEGEFVSEQVKSVQAELHGAERQLQTFLKSNREFRNSPELSFEYDRLQRNLAMRQQVYTSLLQSYDQTRIDAMRDTPMLAVIDDPAGTAQPQRRQLVTRTAIALLIGLLLAMGLAFLLEMIRYSRQTNETPYREFKRLSGDALADLRRPSRLLRRS